MNLVKAIRCFRLVLGLGFLLGWQGVQAQWPTQLQLVEGISTPADEVVLGSDGRQLILLTRQEGPENWSQGKTRIAAIEGAPWTVQPAEDWGHVPSREPAWEQVGELVHVDIDPESGMAVISAVQAGRHSVWLSGRQPDGAWSSPWPLPGLNSLKVQATFAMFDPNPERSGDLLLALRPDSRQDEAAIPNQRGRWKGGWDVARMPRRGNYSAVWFLDDLNTTANEWALAPHPLGGGWLSTERMAGRGGVDAWWCPGLPLNEQRHFGDPSLAGHTLTVQCEGIPVPGMSWEVVEVTTGILVDEVFTDAQGVAHMEGLSSGKRYRWSARSSKAGHCPSGTAVWRDAEGNVVQVFRMSGGEWSLEMLMALRIGGWQVEASDRSRLPNPDYDSMTMAAADGPAAWVVFHGLGSTEIRKEDALRIKAWAIEWKATSSGQLLVLGHASADGDSLTNRGLAEERARQVAVHLEFAGVTPDRIRIEGRGSEQPLLRCPEGVVCPEEAMARSRRTELFPIPLQRP